VLVLADGRCAAVAHDFEIDYEMGGRLVEMRGRDLMTLEKRDGRWCWWPGIWGLVDVIPVIRHSASRRGDSKMAFQTTTGMFTRASS
jgi:hypothetical protein